MEMTNRFGRGLFGHKLAIYLLTVVFGVSFIAGCSENSMNNTRQANSSFGISNSYKGRLPSRLEDKVPQPMHNAFWIEPVRDITATELNEITKEKQFIAEEVNNGQLYVAMRDLRMVQIDTFSTGLLVFIERYRVIDN